MKGNTRQRNLLIFLGLLLLFVAWRYLIAPAPGGDAETPVATARRTGIEDEDGGGGPLARRSTGRGGESQGARPGDQVAELRVGDLDRLPPSLAVGRDPWRFVEPPPPPPPKPPPPPPPPSAEELQRMEEARRRAEEAARLAAIEAAKPKPAEFTLEYLGLFGPPDKRIAVFSDGKAEIIKREGEVIDNKFIVARIGYESVDIRFVGFPDWPAKRVGIKSR